MEKKPLSSYKELNQFIDAVSEEYLHSHFMAISLTFDQLRKFINDYNLTITKLYQLDISDLKSYLQLKNFNKNVLVQLQKSQEDLKNYGFENFWETPNNKLLAQIEQQKRYFKIKEEFNGYEINNKLNIPLFTKKILANTSLNLAKRRKIFYNFFRKIFRKESLELKNYRNRRIPLHSMLKKHFINHKESYQQELIKIVMTLKSQVLLKIWEFDEELEKKLQNSQIKEDNSTVEQIIDREKLNSIIEELLNLIDETEISCKVEIENMLLSSFKAMNKSLDLVDTPDLPIGNYKASIYKQSQIDIIESSNSQLNKWANTHRTLLDDWIVDVEIMYLYFSVLHNFAKLNKKIDRFISQNLSINIDAIKAYLNESSESISQVNSIRELKKRLQEEKTKNNDELVDNLLATTINKLSGSINNDIEEFRTQTINLVSEISKRRGFTKNKNYEKGIKNSEISWLSVQELIQFEAIPQLNSSIKKVDDFVAHHLEKARLKLIAMGTVCDFSLESAIMMLDDKKGNIESYTAVVANGYNRALSHLDEAISQIEYIKESPLENLQSAINEFNTNIQKLKNTDTILELNIKIAKIKAIERSKVLRKRFFDFFINLIPGILNLFKSGREFLQNNLKEINKRLGVISEKTQISHELSDFLGKTEESLKKLPFVYQRLYQLQPTDDERFFVGREEELKKLNSSYTNWQKDHFVTTAIIGEKGNGTSSLILYFLKNTSPDIPIIHHEVTGKTYFANDFYRLFDQLLQHSGFKSVDEIIQHINDLPDRQIIILENLQHLFIKKVKGFVCQKMLFDLMTSTSKKVFWIGTYTIHSWQYLEKTIDISSVYINEIHLSRFTDETLEQMIFKRNYLSGYQVDFEASEQNLKSKTFQKLKESEKQPYLKKSFFKELNQMSNGNVSLSQLYWLRSTIGIYEEGIKIKSLSDFDVSFDKDLPSSYLFALHALLVHDGLNISDYSKVFKSPEYICRNDLIPMLEKGLLIKPKEKYNINPIIFRQVVQLLQSHNFIN